MNSGTFFLSGARFSEDHNEFVCQRSIKPERTYRVAPPHTANLPGIHAFPEKSQTLRDSHECGMRSDAIAFNHIVANDKYCISTRPKLSMSLFEYEFEVRVEPGKPSSNRCILNDV